jgi:hypothetical protein
MGRKTTITSNSRATASNKIIGCHTRCAMDMLPQGRKVMETALESVYNGGNVDEAYETVVEQFNRAIEQGNRARGK